MRAWLIAVVVIAACKSAGKNPAPTAPAANLGIAKVASTSVLAADDPPPFLIFVDDSGKLRVGAAASWADAAKPDVLAKTKTADLDTISKFIAESFMMGEPPVRALADWAPGAPVDLGALEKKRGSAAEDDPPPPPPEDMPDDGTETGGTGTAMALDEGKMGKKDSDRAEGQYKMQKEQPAERGPTMFDELAKLPTGGVDVPSRLARVVGGVVENGKLEGVRSVVFAPPTMKAIKLIDVVAYMGAAIAVVHDGTIRPLRINFAPSRDSTFMSEPGWVEARVSVKGLVIEAVPDAPLDATLEPKALAAVIAKAREARGTKPSAPLDVLVDADVDVQRLVDVLVALDTAGVRSIGMGSAPTPEQLKLRGHRTPAVALGMPAVNGDLDKAEIRKVVRASKSKFLDCYTKALPAQPNLHGTVQTEFLITPEGKVASATSTGVDPQLATCVQSTFQQLGFPKSKGGIQVVYPMTMWE